MKYAFKTPQHTVHQRVRSLLTQKERMKSMMNEWTVNYNTRGNKRGEKEERKKTMMHYSSHLYLCSPTAWDFHPCDIKPRGKKLKKEREVANSTQGLFFSINNSFWHIGEGVKLDILEEHSLQQRMTRNNEEILPQTLSPAEWRHESTKKN